MALTQIQQAMLADGILTADTAGRLKMADGFVNTAKLLDGLLSADATGRAKMADGFVNSAKLAANTVFAQGQTWQTVSRSYGTTYTNTSGLPIMVSFMREGGGGAAYTYLYGYVDGQQVVSNSVYAPGGYSKPLGIYFIVPNGSTYRVDLATDSGSDAGYKEFRV